MQMTLDADKIIATVDRLSRRISERFPGRGLDRLAADFTRLARQMRSDALALNQPDWILRLTPVGLLIAGVALFGLVIKELHFKTQLREVGTLVQILEPAANIAILVALGIAFIVRMESRWKRKKALASLHHLRAMIHVIDMHQLTKDPASLLGGTRPTASSPKRTMSESELQRYLDYCSEMLSLTGKLAALYMQSVQDPLVVDTVNELESLSTNLSRKIWQKIMILDRALPKPAKQRKSTAARKTA